MIGTGSLPLINFFIRCVSYYVNLLVQNPKIMAYTNHTNHIINFEYYNRTSIMSYCKFEQMCSAIQNYK